MQERSGADQGGAKVIEFPVSRVSSPPPLPPLPHATPLPGYRPPQGVFASAFTARYDRAAA